MLTSLHLDDKTLPPDEVQVEPEAFESRGTTPLRIAMATFACLLTACLLMADFVATEIWAAAGVIGTMSEGSAGGIVPMVEAVLAIKLASVGVLAFVAALILRKLRRPRGVAGAWVVTGAVFCLLLSTFAISGTLVPLLMLLFEVISGG